MEDLGWGWGVGVGVGEGDSSQVNTVFELGSWAGVDSALSSSQFVGQLCHVIIMCRLSPESVNKVIPVSPRLRNSSLLMHSYLSTVQRGQF